MRVVLDTNVFVSATLIRGGNEDRVLRGFQRGRFDLVISPPILEEIGRVLFYARLRKKQWPAEEEIRALIRYVAEASFLAPGRLNVAICRDPEDNKFLAAALEAGARYLVSGDKDLLDLGSHSGVDIVTPSAFLRVLRHA